MATPTLIVKDATGTNRSLEAHLDAASNRVPVSSADTYIPTYSAGGTVLVANMAASLTDLVVLRGSATKTVRVKRIRVECGATTGATIPITLKKHSVANTGGTAITTPDIVPYDSSDAAGTAVPIVYSANPTIDGTAKQFAARNLCTTALTTAPGFVEFNFVDFAEHAVVLRGVAQELALNFGGTTPGAGAVLTWNIVWTEEDEA